MNNTQTLEKSLQTLTENSTVYAEVKINIYRWDIWTYAVTLFNVNLYDAAARARKEMNGMIDPMSAVLQFDGKTRKISR